MRCAGCGRENADHYKFCLGCGQELAPPGGRAQAGEAGRIAALLDEARDFERFGLLDEAIERLEQEVALAPERSEPRRALEALRARRTSGA